MGTTITIERKGEKALPQMTVADFAIKAKESGLHGIAGRDSGGIHLFDDDGCCSTFGFETGAWYSNDYESARTWKDLATPVTITEIKFTIAAPEGGAA